MRDIGFGMAIVFLEEESLRSRWLEGGYRGTQCSSQAYAGRNRL